MGGKAMRKPIAASLGALFLAALGLPGMAAYAWEGGVHWQTIIGTFFIGATPGTSANTVGGIVGGGEPWSTTGGEANVNLIDNQVEFSVTGLVLAGGNSIGTPGTVTLIEGTLVCNPSSSTPTVFSTLPVTLSPQGNAEFSGSFTSSPAGCSPTAVAFLITIPSNGHWIANGAVQWP
jgi:hypothetical protein